MSLLLDVLRKAEEGRHPPDTAPQQAFPQRPMALEPIDAAPHLAPLAAREQIRPEIHTQPDTHLPPPTPKVAASQPPQTNPNWKLISAAACATGLIAAIWLWLTSPAAALAHPGPPPVLAPEPASLPATPRFEPLVEPTRPLPAPVHRSAAASKPAFPAPIASDNEPVRFHLGNETAPPRLLATRAHDAYTADDLVLARTLFLQALAADPLDIDALDGLGAIALREGRQAEAETFFRRALVARPQDPVALAGLSRLQIADPLQTESSLRNRLATQPDAPENLALRLALADTLGRQQRWAEAQQAWFDAHRLAPDDPDIAYNLAVSLDHLGQTPPAARYYRKALQLSERRPARFSSEHAETRLNALQATEPPP